MVLDFTIAKKAQLLQIAMFEDCKIDWKYAAVKELQRRKRLAKEDYLPQIVYLFSKGLIAPEIARELSISSQKVEKTINQHKLWKVRLNREMKR